jgi:predicted nucleic acid-binding protein
MRHVIDASVSVVWEVASPLSRKADLLRNNFRNGIHELLAPETIIWETADALIKLERQKVLLPGRARPLFIDFLKTQPVLYGAAALIHRAMTIALQSRAGLYDCLYVALAEREQCELATADQRLVNSLQNQFPLSNPWHPFPELRSRGEIVLHHKGRDKSMRRTSILSIALWALAGSAVGLDAAENPPAPELTTIPVAPRQPSPGHRFRSRWRGLVRNAHQGVQGRPGQEDFRDSLA